MSPVESGRASHWARVVARGRAEVVAAAGGATELLAAAGRSVPDGAPQPARAAAATARVTVRPATGHLEIELREVTAG
jgi:hypothetical protein